MMTVELFATPEQFEIINCQAKFMGLFAGRRWGKTDTFFNRCVKRCLETPGFNYVYVAPSYGLAKEQYDRISASLSQLVKRAVGQPKPVIEFFNGSRIHFRSFDKPKYLRGLRRIGEVWADEIQDFKEVDFWTVLSPLVADLRGTIVVSGQFRGLGCWYYEPFYAKGQVAGQDFYKSWKKPSSSGLVFQDPVGMEWLARKREILTKAQYLQEYECEPVANQAAVFLTEDLLACKARPGKKLDAPERDGVYILGYDLGEMADPSALCVFDHVRKCVVSTEQIPLRTKHEVQAGNLAKRARFWNNGQVVIDGTAGGAGGQRLSDENIKHYRKHIPDVRALVWAPGFKREMVRALSLEIESHAIAIPAEHRRLHEQLASFEYQRRGEEYTYGCPNIADDEVAALMMANHASRAGWVKTGGGSSLGSILY